MVPAAMLAVLLFICIPAHAQSPYVTAAVGMDVSRFDHVDGAGVLDAEADGEAVAFALRLGTAIGTRWGVELGFTHPSEIAREVPFGYPVPLDVVPEPLPAYAIDGTTGIAFPIFQARTRTERRHVTLDTVAWVAQRVGTRAEIVYLGGLAFSRITEDLQFAFQFARPVGIVSPALTRTTMYTVGPMVGVEGRIALTDHVVFVPGVRLQGIGGNGTGGWLLRAATGLGWRF